MAEKKGSALSAAQHNKYTKCFRVLPIGTYKCQCINEKKWFGFSDYVAHFVQNMPELTEREAASCTKFTHVAVKKSAHAPS